MFVNKLNVTQVIKVLDPNGKPDSINLQPRGRVALPPGYTVDPSYAGSLMDNVKDTEGEITAALAKQQKDMAKVANET